MTPKLISGAKVAIVSRRPEMNMSTLESDFDVFKEEKKIGGAEVSFKESDLNYNSQPMKNSPSDMNYCDKEQNQQQIKGDMINKVKNAK